jgi:hypothetical protein
MKVKPLCYQNFYNSQKKALVTLSGLFFKMSIMKKICILLLVALTSHLAAQVRVCKGNSQNEQDIWFTIFAGQVFTGNSTQQADCIYTFKNPKIYQGNSTAFDDCLYTIDYDKIYKGNSVAPFDGLFYIEYGFEKVYTGLEANKKNLKYNFKNNKVYRGNSTKDADCIATILDMYDMAIVTCILEELNK